MFRSMLRLIRAVLPALVVAAAWACWWITPERPVKEWRLRGVFGLGYAVFDLARDRAEIQTSLSAFDPSVMVRLEGSADPPPFDAKPDPVWAVDLASGKFCRLPDDHRIDDYSDFRQPGAKLTWNRVLDRLQIIDESTGRAILRTECWPNAWVQSPTISPDGRWLTVGEGRQSAPNSSIGYLTSLLGPFGPQIGQVCTRVFDVHTGKQVNDVPVRLVNHWIPTTDQFWTADTIFTPSRKPAGVTIRLWSVHAAMPPWWLWGLTVLGVGAQIYNILRGVRRARAHLGGALM